MTSSTLVAPSTFSFPTSVIEAIDEELKQKPTYALCKELSYVMGFPTGILSALTATTFRQMVEKLVEASPGCFEPLIRFKKEHSPLLAFSLCKLAQVVSKYQVKPDEFMRSFMRCQTLEATTKEFGEEVVNASRSSIEKLVGEDWRKWRQVHSKNVDALLHSPSLAQTTAAEVKQKVHEPLLHPFYRTWCSVKDSEEDHGFQADYQCKLSGELETIDFPVCIAKYTLKYFDFCCHPDFVPSLQLAFHKMLNCCKKLAALGVPIENLERLRCLVVLGSADWLQLVSVRLEINQQLGSAVPMISGRQSMIIMSGYPTSFLLAFSIHQRQAIESAASCVGAQNHCTVLKADWEEVAMTPRLDCCEPLGRLHIPYVPPPAKKQIPLCFIQCFPYKLNEIEVLQAKGKNLNLQSIAQISVTPSDKNEEVVSRICSQLNVEKWRAEASLYKLQDAISFLLHVRGNRGLPEHVPLYLIAYEETVPVRQLSSHEEQIKCARSIVEAAASLHAAGLVHGNIDSSAIRYNELTQEYSLDVSTAQFMPSLSTIPTIILLEEPNSAALDRWEIAVQLGRIVAGVTLNNKVRLRAHNQEFLFGSLKAAKTANTISENVFSLIVKLMNVSWADADSR